MGMVKCQQVFLVIWGNLIKESVLILLGGSLYLMVYISTRTKIIFYSLFDNVKACIVNIES